MWKIFALYSSEWELMEARRGDGNAVNAVFKTGEKSNVLLDYPSMNLWFLSAFLSTRHLRVKGGNPKLPPVKDAPQPWPADAKKDCARLLLRIRDDFPSLIHLGQRHGGFLDTNQSSVAMQIWKLRTLDNAHWADRRWCGRAASGNIQKTQQQQNAACRPLWFSTMSACDFFFLSLYREQTCLAEHFSPMSCLTGHMTPKPDEARDFLLGVRLNLKWGLSMLPWQKHGL